MQMWMWMSVYVDADINTDADVHVDVDVDADGDAEFHHIIGRIVLLGHHCSRLVKGFGQQFVVLLH